MAQTRKSITKERPSGVTQDVYDGWLTFAGNSSKVECYSDACHRFIYSQTKDNGYHCVTSYYIYDYDMRTSTLICSGDDIRYHYYDEMNRKGDIAFVSFAVYDDEDEETKRTIVLDNKFNNAPNISGNDPVFDPNIHTECRIMNGCLYFEYRGTCYLIDGDYNVIAKFPHRLSKKYSAYVNIDTRHFILCQMDGKYSLYDKDEKRDVLTDIERISMAHYAPDFVASNGDIYKYDRERGVFELHSQYDSFIDTLSECPGYRSNEGIPREDSQKGRLHLMTDEIRVYKDAKQRFYIIQDNLVVNKNCPFDDIDLVQPQYSVPKYICSVDTLKDVYIGFNTFKFNTLDIDGKAKDEKIWFDV